MSAPAQRLVVYEKDGRDVFYATAYTEQEAREQVVNCISRYGRGARVRTIDAPPPQKGPKA
ncbi:MAG TPA: hypothetical protein VM582_09580 [Candidatus Thermoplasmatota archaeon]|nr:hypothetical protein [Candidatus Thermoplasmatota archaeon]